MVPPALGPRRGPSQRVCGVPSPQEGLSLALWALEPKLNPGMRFWALSMTMSVCVPVIRDLHSRRRTFLQVGKDVQYPLTFLLLGRVLRLRGPPPYSPPTQLTHLGPPCALLVIGQNGDGVEPRPSHQGLHRLSSQNAT